MRVGAPGTQEAPWGFAAPWAVRAWVTDLDGPVHWIEFGNADAEVSGLPPIVFVHGLGGSHLNWTLIGPALAQGRRAVALDLRGFGLSPGDRGTTSVHANAALVDRFVREVVGAPAVLVGNSMGAMISVLQAHAHPETVAGVVLVDPALPQPPQRPDLGVARQFLMFAAPGIGELHMKMLNSRVSSRQLVQRVVDLCFADPSRADPAVIAAAIALAEHRRSLGGKEESLLTAARSLMRVLLKANHYRAMLAGIGVPVLLIHGEQDRLVSIAAARRVAALNPAWETLLLPGIGHTPQLEDPDIVIDAVTAWLARNPTLTAR